MHKLITEELEKLKSCNLYRQPRVIESDMAEDIVIDGEKYLNLCSNNYLGLANHPKLKEAALKATRKFGTGTGGSRLICGNHAIHNELEEKIAKFKGSEAALVFNSGYTANLGIISALAGRDDIIFSDRLNHASIVDAIKLSGAQFKRYLHKDIGNLEMLLKENKFYKNKFIITDSVFSMDGDIAPIPEILKLSKRHNCVLIIDDAHATGVLGKTGRGSLEHFGIKANSNIIVMGTFSKALGSFGAFVCAGNNIIDYLINKSRPFIYSTSLPTSVIAASIAAVDLLSEAPAIMDNLWVGVEFFRNGLDKMGFNTLASKTQIIPILLGKNETAVEFSRELFENRIFASAIRPPAVPVGQARLRISITAGHKIEQLKTALETIKQIAKRSEAV